MHLDLQPLNLLVIENIEPYNNSFESNQSSMNDSLQLDSMSRDDNSDNLNSHRFIHLTNFCISSGFLRKKFSSNYISSLYFMSPERICGEINCDNELLMQKSDVWSVGVLLFLLVFGKAPFDGRLNTSLVKSIKNGNIKLKDNQWDEDL